MVNTTRDLDTILEMRQHTDPNVQIASVTTITIISPLSTINVLDYWGVIKCKIHRVNIRAMNHILIPLFIMKHKENSC
jgi:hypothetical protein